MCSCLGGGGAFGGHVLSFLYLGDCLGRFSMVSGCHRSSIVSSFGVRDGFLSGG